MPGREVHRADVIEEDERADHVPARERQHAPDFEAAEVAAALVDDIHAGIVWGQAQSAQGQNGVRPRFRPEMGTDPYLARATSGTAPDRSSRRPISPNEKWRRSDRSPRRASRSGRRGR